MHLLQIRDHPVLHLDVPVLHLDDPVLHQLMDLNCDMDLALNLLNLVRHLVAA
jgi:hypothetical protein